MDLINIDHASKPFPLPDGKGEYTVLDDVSLDGHPREVLALLGRSGSGKSTLLRIMAALIQPSEGQRCSHDNPMPGAKPNPAVVFQSFALLPWLTVQETVELGLAARHGPGLSAATGRSGRLTSWASMASRAFIPRSFSVA